MRFKTGVRNIKTLTKFTASLAAIGKLAWVRLDNDNARFTIIPEKGTQVWAVLAIDSVFEDYTIQSAAENDTINLELPIGPLNRALKSAANATSASLRLTKKDGLPILSLTVIVSGYSSGNSANGLLNGQRQDDDPFADASAFHEEPLMIHPKDRETIITQAIPVRVMLAAHVEGLHEPHVRPPEVHIMLPSLMQLKAISDRFTKLASATHVSTGIGLVGSTIHVPKLELSANMHGSLKLALATDSLNICSEWTGLSNPDLDVNQIDGGEEALADNPAMKFKEAGPDAWAKVRIDGKDWSKVLSVGRLGGRVIACFVDDNALILYVYLYEDANEDGSVLTYYISSYSA